MSGKHRSVYALVSLALFAGGDLAWSDCNSNGIDDASDLASGVSVDCNGNQIPDECENRSPRFALDGDGHGRTLTRAPQGVIIGDFDGDGLEDVATANKDPRRASSVLVLLSGADSSIASSAEIDVEGSISYISSADVDNDGDLDLVTANSTLVLVLENDGKGAFAVASTVPVAAFTRFAIATDLDGDQLAEIITANKNSSQVTIHRNLGEGAFGPGTILSAGDQPSAVTATDVNGDGHTDLAVCNWRSNDASILLGDGKGQFAPPVHYETGGSSLLAIVSGDLNDDATVDLAVASFKGVSVLLNQTDGSFLPAVVYDGVPSSLALADIEGDGDLDLVSVLPGNGSVSALLNEGEGTFSNTTGLAVIWQSDFATVGDIDGNGAVDIAVTSELDQRLVRMFGGQSGRLRLASRTHPMGNRPHGAVLADLDEDGFVDLLCPTGHGRTISMLLGDSTGLPRVQRHHTVTESSRLHSIDVADFDGDGDLDLVTADTEANRVRVLLSAAQGALAEDEQLFSEERAFVSDWGPFMVRAGDLDGDGHIDIASANPASNSVSLLFNAGDAMFEERIDLGVGSHPLALTVQDLDGDLDLDLAVTNGNSASLSILANLGNRVFAEPVDLPVPVNPRFAVAADFDGDGDIDLATANGFSDDVTVFPNRGDGTFESRLSSPIGHSPYSLIVADLDEDGIPDLATANEEDGSVAVLLGRGDGTFGEPFFFAVGTGPRFVLAYDFDNDGDADLICANRQSNDATLLLNQLHAPLTENGAGGVPCFAGPEFRRADVDAGGSVDTLDALMVLNYLFARGPSPTCLKSADVDDSGSIQLLDAIWLVRFVFRRGAPPEEPFSSCGSDVTEDHLDCSDFSACS